MKLTHVLLIAIAGIVWSITDAEASDRSRRLSFDGQYSIQKKICCNDKTFIDPRVMLGNSNIQCIRFPLAASCGCLPRYDDGLPCDIWVFYGTDYNQILIKIPADGDSIPADKRSSWAGLDPTRNAYAIKALYAQLFNATDNGSDRKTNITNVNFENDSKFLAFEIMFKQLASNPKVRSDVLYKILVELFRVKIDNPFGFVARLVHCDAMGKKRDKKVGTLNIIDGDKTYFSPDDCTLHFSGELDELENLRKALEDYRDYLINNGQQQMVDKA